MKDLDGKKITIGSLLSQEFFFRIPAYQRPFSWEGDNFEDLVDDIVTAATDQEYFLGTIVLQEMEEKGHYEVVDGQQRLTSLLILLACLRDRVDSKDHKTGIQDKILQRKNVVDGIPERVRLEVKDREIFTEIVIKQEGTIKQRRERDLPEPQSRYVEAVNIFAKRLAGLKQKETRAVIEFINQKCVVIYLATPTFDDAFRLFTIVNDRGKQLRRIDVLKSLNIAPEIVSKESVRDRIAQRWEELEKDVGETIFENVFHLLRLILLQDKPQGDLLKEFQDRIFTKGTITKGEPFVDLVFEYVELYKSVFVDKEVVPEGQPTEVKYKSLIHIMDAEFRASEWRACVLFFAKKFKGQSVYEFCLRIEKVYLEHWFGGVRKDERYATYSKILGLISTSKKPEDVLDGITYSKDVITDGIGRSALYGAGFCKYVLLRLELLASELDVPKEFSPKSIEHVFPQKPDQQGYWADHHDLSGIDEYVDSVGNLVLLSKSKNSSARNFDFSIKKERYLKSRVSDYPRSIQVLDYDDWTKDTIMQRTKEAVDTFLNDL